MNFLHASFKSMKVVHLAFLGLVISCMLVAVLSSYLAWDYSVLNLVQPFGKASVIELIAKSIVAFVILIALCLFIMPLSLGETLYILGDHSILGGLDGKVEFAVTSIFIVSYWVGLIWGIRRSIKTRRIAIFLAISIVALASSIRYLVVVQSILEGM